MALRFYKLEQLPNKQVKIQYTGTTAQELISFNRMMDNIVNKFYDVPNDAWLIDEQDISLLPADTKDTEDKQIIKEDLTHIGEGMKLSPYEFQKEAIFSCINNKSRLIMLPCGAGKTAIGLGLYHELRKQDETLRGIVVVKATLKSQWLSEVSKFTNYNATIIQSFKSSTHNSAARLKKLQKKLDTLMDNAIGNADKILSLEKEIKNCSKTMKHDFSSSFDASKYDLFIINYENLADEEVKKCIKKLNPQFWYVDEIDCIKSHTAKRHKNICLFKNAKWKFGATATPIRKNPQDVYGIFSFLIPSLFTLKEFNDRYVKMWHFRIIGSKNEEELKKTIEPFIFTKTMEEIANQLPTQTVVRLLCNMTPEQQQMTETILDEIQDLKDQEKALYAKYSPEELKTLPVFKQLEGNIVARQTFAQMLCDSEELLKESDSNLSKKYITKTKDKKLELCIALLEKIMETGNKACIFSTYVGMQKIIEKEVHKKFGNKIRCAKISGSVSDAERAAIIDDYNASDDCPILLLSDAGEAGLNLKYTKYLIEYEPANSAARQTQRYGRIRRSDSAHRQVFVYQLIAKNSYDEIALKIIEKKAKYSHEIL